MVIIFYVREGKEREEIEKMSCSDKEEEEFLPGFRFHPTDEELVGYYLKRKVEKKPLSIELIKQIDIYKYDPWELPKEFSSTGDKEWYFFCRRGRKYKNSIRPNRVTGSGFWKATGIDKPIYGMGEKSDDCIGLKKSLVYYRGSAGKGTKTDWMMHEFRLPSNASSKTTTNLHAEKSKQEAEIWTICRIFKRTVTYKKYSQDGSNSSVKRTTPTNTCSNTSSFESDDADTYHFFGTSSAPQQIIERKPLVSHTEGNYFFSGQLGSIPQSAAFSNLYPTIPNPYANEFYHRDGNWDELGAIVDQFAIDPALVGGCKYS